VSPQPRIHIIHCLTDLFLLEVRDSGGGCAEGLSSCLLHAEEVGGIERIKVCRNHHRFHTYFSLMIL
jgi:hypothetical protein